MESNQRRQDVEERPGASFWQGEPTMGWTRTIQDTAGRAVEVNHFSGATQPAPWGSNGARTGFATSTYGIISNNLSCLYIRRARQPDFGDPRRRDAELQLQFSDMERPVKP